MGNKLKRNYLNDNFMFINSDFPVDTKDRQMIEAIKMHNSPFLVNYYRNNNMKNFAINTILQQRKSSLNVNSRNNLHLFIF